MLLCQHKTVEQGGSMRILAVRTVFIGKIWITDKMRYARIKTNIFVVIKQCRIAFYGHPLSPFC